MKIKILSFAFLLSLLWLSCKNEAPTQTEAAPAETTQPATQPQTAEQPVMQQNPTIQQEATPQMNATDASGQKLNPPHGQPGHRCDIAVGAPLPQ